ncbi:hypothetical protein [Stieleria varia]|uniref:hypothetical protein n=1 Tax=Stieleria varia TaxID=2528005 RepID=UPI001E6083D2|nr:hypothetical protein [Stieleria varia]
MRRTSRARTVHATSSGVFSCRLRLERLESRCMLAAAIVDTLDVNDDGRVS